MSEVRVISVMSGKVSMFRNRDYVGYFRAHNIRIISDVVFNTPSMF